MRPAGAVKKRRHLISPSRKIQAIIEKNASFAFFRVRLRIFLGGVLWHLRNSSHTSAATFFVERKRGLVGMVMTASPHSQQHLPPNKRNITPSPL